MSGARPDTWMPLYIGDYLADTVHLTRDQHGGYLLLIFAYWRHGGPLPDDDEELSNICRASAKEWKALRLKMARLFQIEGGLWKHKRIEQELRRSQTISNERSKAGAKGAAKRWQSYGNLEAKRCYPQSQPQRKKEDDAIASSGALDASPNDGKAQKSKRGTRLPSDWEPSADDRAFAAIHGFCNGTYDELVAEFGDYWRAVPGQRGLKLDWSATFRNRVRQKTAPGVGNGRSERPKRGGTAEIRAGIARAFADCFDEGEGGTEADRPETVGHKIG